MTDTYIKTKSDYSLRIIQISNNKPTTIFFFHGLGGRAEQWREQIKFFSKDYNIIAPDMIGHGQSAKPKPNDTITYSFAELIADMQAIFDKFKTEKNIIVGHSYGGALATYLTLKNPNTTEKLILIAPLSLAPIPVAAVFNLPVFLLEFMRPFLDAAFVKMAFHPQTNKQLIAQETAANKKNSMPIIKALVKGMAKIPNENITTIQQPALVFTSTIDRVVPTQTIKKFYSQLPQVTFLDVDNASHMMMLEQPQFINNHIQLFLKK